MLPQNRHSALKRRHRTLSSESSNDEVEHSSPSSWSDAHRRKRVRNGTSGSSSSSRHRHPSSTTYHSSSPLPAVLPPHQGASPVQLPLSELDIDVSYVSSTYTEGSDNSPTRVTHHVYHATSSSSSSSSSSSRSSRRSPPQFPHPPAVYSPPLPIPYLPAWFPAQFPFASPSPPQLYQPFAPPAASPPFFRGSTSPDSAGPGPSQRPEPGPASRRRERRDRRRQGNRTRHDSSDGNEPGQLYQSYRSAEAGPSSSSSAGPSSSSSAGTGSSDNDNNNVPVDIEGQLNSIGRSLTDMDQSLDRIDQSLARILARIEANLAQSEARALVAPANFPRRPPINAHDPRNSDLDFGLAPPPSLTDVRSLQYLEKFRIEPEGDRLGMIRRLQEILRLIARLPRADQVTEALEGCRELKRAQVNYTPDLKSKDMAQDTICPICKDKYEPSSRVIITPCDHMYHQSCLKTWLEDSVVGEAIRTCPLCRRNVAARQTVLRACQVGGMKNEEEANTIWLEAPTHDTRR